LNEKANEKSSDEQASSPDSSAAEFTVPRAGENAGVWRFNSEADCWTLTATMSRSGTPARLTA
jgi:hypothetical protein